MSLLRTLLFALTVILHPGDNIQAAVNANAAGTAFRLTAGTYANQGVIPKSGNSFVGDSGAVLDGGGSTARAFWGWNGARWVDSVTIRGLRITHYAPPAQDGAISAGDVSGTVSGTAWVIDSVQVDSVANLGVRIGDRTRLTRSRILANGTLGVGGTGRAALIEGNEIAWNAQGATVAAMDFEAGATKFVRTDSAIVRGNWVHDNGGPGIWFDIENDHALIESNRVERNVREGIVNEIGYAAIIRNNTLIGNGQSDTRKAAWPWGACIGLHSSGPGIDVYGNTCTDNAAGIVAIQQARGTGARGPYLAQGITVHDNTVDPGLSWPGAHANGAVTDVAGDTLFRRGLTFQHNTIVVRANPAPYAWENGWRSIAQWRAFGNDTASVRSDTVIVHDTVRVQASTQSTNADDSAHVKAVRARIAGWLRAEARTKPGPRPSILLAIGKLADSLEIAHLARPVPMIVHDTIAVHDTVFVRDSATVPPDTLPTPPPPDTLPTPPVDTGHTPPPATLGIVELPRSVPTAATPPPARRVLVRAGTSLQAALDTVQAGDELVLDAGGVWRGNFVLRARSCTAGWVTIRTGGSVPPAGTRLDGRNSAQVAVMAALVSPGGGASPALRTEANADCYRIEGLEITLAIGAAPTTSLLNLGDGSAAQNSLAQVPTNLIASHLYVHGDAAVDLKRCIALHSANTAIVDSWLSDCHASGADSQAIGCYNGPGPYLIENNYLEGAGMSLMCGGADPGIKNNVAADITIRRNHMTKPSAWVGGKWQIKNLLELKSAQRVLIEANVFENTWNAAQAFAVLFKSSNQAGACTSCGTTDVTFRYNIVRTSASGINIAAHPEQYPVVLAARMLIEQNLITDIGKSNGTTDGKLLQLLGALSDVTVTRNTLVHNMAGTFLWLDLDPANPIAAQRIAITDNLATAAAYGIKASGKAGLAALSFFSPGSVFTGNVLIGVSAANRALYPGVSFAALLSDVFTAPSTDWHPIGPYAGLGADVSAVLAATAGVVLP